MYMNPLASEMIKEAAGRGHRLWIFTNAILMTLADIQVLARTPNIWRITISLYGYDKDSYIAQTGRDNFQKAYRNIYDLLDILSRSGAMKSSASTTITINVPKTRIMMERQQAVEAVWGSMIKRFNEKKNTLRKGVYGTYFRSSGGARLEWFELDDNPDGRLHLEKENEGVVFHGFGCGEQHGCSRIAWDCQIFPNGDVSYCCGNMDHEGIIGNINQSPLSECWGSRLANDFRTLFANGYKQYVPLCNHCAMVPGSNSLFGSEGEASLEISDDEYLSRYLLSEGEVSEGKRAAALEGARRYWRVRKVEWCSSRVQRVPERLLSLTG